MQNVQTAFSTKKMTWISQVQSPLAALNHRSLSGPQHPAYPSKESC